MPLSPTDALAIHAEKQALRRHFLSLRAEQGEEERARVGKLLCERLIASEAFRNARTVLCYAPVRGELDVLPIARQALALGKRVALPISNVDTLTLSFRAITTLDDLVEGAYRIPEPPKDAPLITNLSELSEKTDTLCIVPALAFDRSGYRLGYGKGYYDRFLADFGGSSVGLCARPFLVDRLVRDPRDQAVDVLLTDEDA